MKFFYIFILLFFIALPNAVTASNAGTDGTVTVGDQGGMADPVGENGHSVVKALHRSLDAEEKAKLMSATVIDRRDIELCIGCDLPKLLERAGVQVRRLNAQFDQSSDTDVAYLSLRGVSKNQILLLVDGVRQENAVRSAPIWTHIPLKHIERIEIVRGPYSALYGDSAIGGVIHIFTKKADCSPGEVCVGGGIDLSNKSNTGETVHGDINFRTDDNQTGVRLGVQGDRSADPGKMKGDFREGTVSLKFDHRQGKLFTEGSLVSHDNRNEGKPEPYIARGESDVVSLGTTYYVSPELLFKALAGYNKEEQFFYGRDTEYTSRRISIKLLGEYYFNFNEDNTYVLTVGLERQREKVDSPDKPYEGNEKSRYTTGVFAQLGGGHGPLTYQLTVRADDLSGETREEIITWKGMASYHVGKIAGYDVFGRVGAGKGFRNPSPDEKLLAFGDPAVSLEESVTRDAGVTLKRDSLSFDVGVYETTLSGGHWPWWVREESGVIQGWEAEARLEMDPCDGRAQYTYTNSDNVLSWTNKPVKRLAFLGMDCHVNSKFILGWGWTHRGERGDSSEFYNDEADTFDVYGLYKIGKQGKNGEGAYVGVAINNLTDEEYEMGDSPERTVWVSFGIRK